MSNKGPSTVTNGRMEDLRKMLETHGQQHVLRFVGELTDPQRKRIHAQIRSINFRELDDLIERYVRNPEPADVPGDLEPSPYYPYESGGTYDAEKYRQIGVNLIRAGKVAAFTVAGGQGTRLGWNGPKGTYPASVVAGKPLFRLFAEQIVAAQRKYGVTIPWYIMTSPLNDADTRAFFQDNNNFGIVRRNIFMFPQGMTPSLALPDGKLMLAAKDEIAMNPDGHGGSIKALADSGAIEDMRFRGIEHISYFQVDNPLVKIIDPLFIGLHAGANDSSAEMSSKMVAKAYPEEKVGVFCHVDGRTRVIEYSDLPEELSKQTDESGNLRYNAGSIAVHMLGVSFVEKLTEDPDHFALPWHRAEKKVPHIDVETGSLIDPDNPNAVKLETFVFDAIPLAEKSIVLETLREEEFAPIKNMTGVDSAKTSHQLQSNRAARWLETHGVKVPRDEEGNVRAEIEISPLTALDCEDLAGVELPNEIRKGDAILL